MPVAQAKDELLAVLGKTATPSNKTTDAHIYAGNGNFVEMVSARR